jgi:hypothetical protein
VSVVDGGKEIPTAEVMTYSRLGSLEQSFGGTKTQSGFQWWVEKDELVIVAGIKPGWDGLRERAMVAWHRVTGKSPNNGPIRFRIISVSANEIVLQGDDQRSHSQHSILRRIVE